MLPKQHKGQYVEQTLFSLTWRSLHICSEYIYIHWLYVFVKIHGANQGSIKIILRYCLYSPHTCKLLLFCSGWSLAPVWDNVGFTVKYSMDIKEKKTQVLWTISMIRETCNYKVTLSYRTNGILSILDKIDKIIFFISETRVTFESRQMS